MSTRGFLTVFGFVLVLLLLLLPYSQISFAQEPPASVVVEETIGVTDSPEILPPASVVVEETIRLSDSPEIVPLAQNTPAGVSVVVNLPPVAITFPSVTGNGTTSASVDSAPCGATRGSLPSGLRPIGSTYHVTTTATYTGPVTVGISYDPASTSDPQNLQMFHCDGTGWKIVTLSRDTVNHIVYGQDSTLSWWQIGDPGGGGGGGAGAGVPVFPNVYIGIGAAIGASGVAYLLRRRFIVRR